MDLIAVSALMFRDLRFNSLQTGKYIQSNSTRSKERLRWRKGFNSLQTGKYIQSPSGRLQKTRSHQVSIPFKRESISKVTLDSGLTVGKMYEFQFPSNGKVYPKGSMVSFFQKSGAWVSIPFKRESISKGKANKFTKNLRKFQFPSNGKVYPKVSNNRINVIGYKFQFPSNGKVYPKTLI